MNRLYLKVIIPTYLPIFLPKTDFLWYFSVKKAAVLNSSFTVFYLLKIEKYCPKLEKVIF